MCEAPHTYRASKTPYQPQISIGSLKPIILIVQVTPMQYILHLRILCQNPQKRVKSAQISSPKELEDVADGLKEKPQCILTIGPPQLQQDMGGSLTLHVSLLFFQFTISYIFATRVSQFFLAFYFLTYFMFLVKKSIKS